MDINYWTFSRFSTAIRFWAKIYFYQAMNILEIHLNCYWISGGQKNVIIIIELRIQTYTCIVARNHPQKREREKEKKRERGRERERERKKERKMMMIRNGCTWEGEKEREKESAKGWAESQKRRITCMAENHLLNSSVIRLYRVQLTSNILKSILNGCYLIVVDMWFCGHQSTSLNCVIE